MTIQVCDTRGIKTYTDITNDKEIQQMLQDIFIFEEIYKVLELTIDEEKILEDCYRKHVATCEMPAIIEGYLFYHDNDWYMFRSDDVYSYHYTVEQHYDNIMHEMDYLETIMGIVGLEVE